MDYTLKKLDENVYLLDFHKKVIVQLKIVGVQGVKVSGRYGPYKDFLKFLLPLQAEINGYLSKIIACRYIELKTEGGELNQANIVAINWMRNVNVRGGFECDDSVLNRTVQICRETLHACMEIHGLGNATIHLQSQRSRDFAKRWHGKTTDYVIFDGARRDREVWVGDLLPEIRTVWAMFADREVIENTLDVILDQMREDGNIPASSISGCEFIEYNAWFLIVLHEYILMSGNEQYLRSNIEKIKKIAAFLEKSLVDGVLEVPQGRTWAWTLSRRGKITGSNCVASYAFYVAAQMLNNDKVLSLHYKKLSDKLKDEIYARAYDDEKGLLRDCLDLSEQRYSLDSNVLAVSFDVIPETEKSKLLDIAEDLFQNPYGLLLMHPAEPPDDVNWIHNEHVWPFLVSMTVEALFKVGKIQRALALVRKTWGNMLENGADTFWEIVDGKTGKFMSRRLCEAEDDRDTWNSACHGWSAGLPELFNRYIAGVEPIVYGYKNCLFHPDLADLQYIYSDIPTGFGNIGVVIQGEKNCYRIHLDIPSGIEMRCACEHLYDEKNKLIKQGEILKSGDYRKEVNL